MGEFSRVLKNGGAIVVTDPLAPSSAHVDTWMNDVEIRRDPTHVRDRTMDEWRALLENGGFALEDFEVTKVYLEFDDWVERSATQSREIDTLRYDFTVAGADVVSAFNIRRDNGVITFHWDVITLRGVKKG